MDYEFSLAEQTNSVDATITNIVEGKTTQDATEEPATEPDIKTDVKVSASVSHRQGYQCLTIGAGVTMYEYGAVSLF